MSNTIWPDNITVEVLKEVYKERRRQKQLKEAGKFAWTLSDSETNSRKFAVLAEEVGEVAKEVTEEMIEDDKGESQEKVKAIRKKIRTELIQVAACAVAWAESLEK